jgi:hypothetical protein
MGRRNIFGYTGMKFGGTDVADQINGQQWSDFTGPNAWLVQQVWDHYLFGSGTVDHLKTHGWPIIKVSKHQPYMADIRVPPNTG